MQIMAPLHEQVDLIIIICLSKTRMLVPLVLGLLPYVCVHDNQY